MPPRAVPSPRCTSGYEFSRCLDYRREGDYQARDYGHVILPLTMLRRLDCVLDPTKDVVMTRARD